MADVQALFDELKGGSRNALSRAITLVESQLDKHIEEAGHLLNQCLKEAKNSIRIGITGSPGVGKSTFINAFGKYLIDNHDLKVAVLAIDPTSSLSGGSILGDKTRMSELSSHPNAFVRPSPSGGDLGGVAARTRESVLLCETAGYDVILIETVGVGQSETMVYDMVDLFLLLIQPGSGDDLQGIKRGIMEMADIIAINKSDGSLEKNARETAAHYSQASAFIRTQRQDWRIEVQRISSVEQKGMDKLWETVVSFRDSQRASNGWLSNRSTQNVKWFRHHLEQEVLRKVRSSETIQAAIDQEILRMEKDGLHSLHLAGNLASKIVRDDK